MCKMYKGTISHESGTPSHLCVCRNLQNGVRPMWEDSANRGGGKFIFRPRKQLIGRVWEETVRDIHIRLFHCQILESNVLNSLLQTFFVGGITP